MIKTNKPSLAGDAAKLTFANVFSLLISLASAMLLARFRTKFEYGTYSQISIAVSLAITVFTLGLPNSINYFFARLDTHKEKQKFLFSYFSITSILSIIAGLFLVIISPLIKIYFHNEDIMLYTYVLLILPITRVVIQSNNNMLIVVGKANRLVLYSLFYNISTLIIIVLVKIFKLGFSHYMLLYTVVQILFTLIVYYWAYDIAIKNESNKIYRFSKNEIKNLIKQILMFSVPLGLGSMVSTISLELDKLMVGNMLSTESLAIYTNASKELPFVILVSSFSAVLMPKMSKMIGENKQHEAVKLWGDSILIGFSLMVFFSTAIISFAPQALTMLYSSKYIEGVNVFIVYTLVLVLRSTYFGIILNVTGNTKKVFYSSLASLALNVILNYLLYLIFGFIGPAIATFICILLVNALQLYYSSKIVDVKIKHIFPWKNMFTIMIKNIALAIPFVFVKQLIGLGTDTKSVSIAFALGVLWTLVYVLMQRKLFKNLWNKINQY